MTRRVWHNCQPIDLFSLAREWFLCDRRLELQKLAQELGISRATAYRWAGSAEQLVGEVLASLVDDSFATLKRSSPRGDGARRVLDVLVRGMHAAYGFQPLRHFLRSNPQLGLRIVASRHGPVQARTIDNVRGLLEEEIEAGTLELAVEPGVMAYALTRMIESFLYADLIVGGKPDLDSAARILGLMLRPAADAAVAPRG